MPVCVCVCVQEGLMEREEMLAAVAEATISLSLPPSL